MNKNKIWVVLLLGLLIFPAYTQGKEIGLQIYEDKENRAKIFKEGESQYRIVIEKTLYHDTDPYEFNIKLLNAEDAQIEGTPHHAIEYILANNILHFKLDCKEFDEIGSFGTYTSGTGYKSNTFVYSIISNEDEILLVLVVKVAWGSHCYIATASYGTSLHQDLDRFRNFRDNVLMKNRFGRAYVDFYYKTSPPIADFIAKHDTLRWIVRQPLKLIAWMLKSWGY